ncbi:LPS export ABC transporter periplasmic protein LptC [Nitrincola tapanii]|uniref:LPS export ABC transporter periplasmic protein LptC n=1 Tax=Nitrincola tapanii TaxID=1708751 RepID=A0A5A9W1H5_9GAMM|nr:LPS export ABC transporter periplasmic protein LptC [Nitrincola tapanii]KAA0874059.1 LPS export ABC transporter periplasmic protein LptC [Nitrincola tapanii]
MVRGLKLRWLLPLFFVSLPLIYWGLFGTPGQTRLSDANDPERIDFFMVNAQMQQFNTMGELARELDSPLVVHKPGQDVLHLTEPLLRLPQPEGEPTRVRADHGIMQDDESEIELAGHVEVIDNSPTGLETRLTTSVLRLLPPENYAETDAPVTVTRGQSRTDAIGMQAWLDQRRVDLLSEVRGSYVKN